MAESHDPMNPNAEDIVVRVHRLYRESETATETWRKNARENYDFRAGRQWDDEALAKMEEQQRPAVTFNRIARVLNTVIGTEVNNRQEVRYIPRELGDTVVNEMFTGAAAWVRDECDAEDEESDAFSDLLTCGMGWTETRPDYDQDIEGSILIERVDPLAMFWDHSATRKNLADARWVAHLEMKDRDEIEQNWPGKEIDPAAAPWDGPTVDEAQETTKVYPQDAYDDTQDRHQHTPAGKIRVMQFQWWEFGPVYRVGAKAVEFTEEKFKRMKDKLDAANIPYIKQRKRVYKQAFIAGMTVLEEGPCPCDFAFTLRGMTGYRDRNKNQWRGMVDDMKDPQRWGNKFYSLFLDIYQKGAKGGIIAETGAVDDARKLEENWAKPEGVTWVNDGAVSKNKIIPKPLVQMPAGMDRMMGFAFEAVHEVTGVNLELIGMADRQQAGVLEAQRKQAGLTILAPLFDSLRKYRKEQGRVLLYFIQKYISDGRLIRILGKDGNEQYIELHKQPETARYDVIVDESPTSPNQKEKVFGALSALLPNLTKMGVPLPPQLLDYAPIPSSLANEWKQLIEKSQKGQEIPPEVQDQMKKMAEENAQLKDKRGEVMAKIEAEREKSAAILSLKQEEAGASASLKRREMEAASSLKRQEAEEEWALKKEESRAALALKREVAQAEFDLKREEAQTELDIQKMKVEGDLMIKDSATPSIKHIKIIRDAGGLMAGAEMSDTVQ